MGVRSCNRKGCDEILCDRLSDRHGYICDWCFKALKAVNPATHEEVREFMTTHKYGWEDEVDLETEFSDPQLST